MNVQGVVYKSFLESDIKSLSAELKVGLLATINDEGLPHLTLISTLQPSSPEQLVFGQFAEGLSKANITKNHKIGFLILTLDRNMWRGRANFIRTAKSGKEFDMFNNIPMFRYNAYFGIHTVYYMDLLEHYGKEPLPMGSIIQAALKTMVAKTFSSKKGTHEALNFWTRQLIGKLSNLKFLSYIDGNGYPVIVPVIQAQTLGNERIVFAASAYREELKAVPVNATVALFCMSFDMEDVLLRGRYEGIRGMGGIQCGIMSVNWVYSPMPPKPEQVYPETKIEAVTSF
ncbi:MAG: hypothetical protein FJ008_02380 [Chloroflexi bacterium]|nr:hypothetical protein [Chloroflexota bacterium]MBM3154162.1 hypothetical protein [Chloroflexota bacterium]MBM3173232.1 hypothetical protein [Chloroflexota bacterium]MBM3174979.1 hypothetical protein [Chloroflexota bacterium]MBM4449765.1 hypothetical protein [Chloroflexota bacterium]